MRTVVTRLSKSVTVAILLLNLKMRLSDEFKDDESNEQDDELSGGQHDFRSDSRRLWKKVCRRE